VEPLVKLAVSLFRKLELPNMPKISIRKSLNTQHIDNKTQLHINLEFSKINAS